MAPYVVKYAKTPTRMKHPRFDVLLLDMFQAHNQRLRDREYAHLPSIKVPQRGIASGLEGHGSSTGDSSGLDEDSA